MKERKRTIRTRMRPLLAAAIGCLGLYLDDLLLIAAGVCFTAAAGRAFGCSAALAVAGCCCLGYSVVVARSRRGGGEP
ncbi:MAG: hypothetical protein K2N78_02795 [Oscillospiraceae bacterium]|nr:hypothetical protein [Oscillospiraceae bacterium]